MLGAMKPALYDTLVPWYLLLDPTADHEAEVDEFERAFEAVIEGRRETLLELGAGAGNNAWFLKRSYRCTLSDVSAPMQRLSAQQNPSCEHVLGDMRALRLERAFDAVLVHDAVSYMTTEADLRAAIATAFVHTRPGGAAIFAPDSLRDEFRESTQLHEGSDGERALRCLEWAWDPDPSDSCCTVEFAFLLRDGRRVEAVHDTHLEGLFERATWRRLLGEAGFDVREQSRGLDDPDALGACSDVLFVCHRPR